MPCSSGVDVSHSLVGQTDSEWPRHKRLSRGPSEQKNRPNTALKRKRLLFCTSAAPDGPVRGFGSNVS